MALTPLPCYTIINDAFQNWLIEVCTGQTPQSEREQRLIDWVKAPSARYCHPREEHLLPLQVCVDMADRPVRIEKVLPLPGDH